MDTPAPGDVGMLLGRPGAAGSLAPPAAQLARRVAVYRSPVLPISETFIRDQLAAMRRWHPVLLGDTLVAPHPPLGDLELAIAHRDTPAGRFARRTCRVAEWLGAGSPRKLALLRRIAPQLLHAHFGTDAVHVWPLARRLGVPMVATLHGYDIHTHEQWWRDGRGGRMMRDYPQRLRAMGADPRVHFVAVSTAVRERAIAFGLPAQRVLVRYIGVDTRRFAPAAPPVSQRAPRVLFVGRMVEKKGARYLLQAAASLRERVPDLRVVLIGEGPQRAELTALAAELGVQADFMGHQPHEEVRRQLESARLLCLPSVTATNGDSEGLGIVLLEAQACGVPVVTSAHTGAEAIIDQVTGFAVEQRDAAALAVALQALLADDARADAMSQAAVRWVRERYDLATCTEGLEAMYDELLAGTAPAVAPLARAAAA